MLGLVGVLSTVGVGGCSERSRITFDPDGNGAGPASSIDHPTQDTTVTAGPDFLVTGWTVDPDGVDTVYFETSGGVTSFPPFAAARDSVRFGLPLTTNGLSGHSIIVRVFGVDRLGNRGDTATRVVDVR